MVGLESTFSKRTYANMPCLPGLLLPVSLSLQQAIAGPCLHRWLSKMHRQIWLSIMRGSFFLYFSLGFGVHKEGSITSWHMNEEKMEAMADFIFLGSKITADSDCSHEIKRYLLLGRKAMTNLDSILKSRDITLVTKFCIVKAMVFPVVMYRCESWTIKKAEHWRMNAFINSGEDSWGFLEQQGDQFNPKGNQYCIFIEKTDAEGETPILWLPDVKSWLTEKIPDVRKLRAGGERDDRRWDGWMASLTQWTWVWANHGV